MLTQLQTPTVARVPTIETAPIEIHAPAIEPFDDEILDAFFEIAADILTNGLTDENSFTPDMEGHQP
jgi:hypothetical protein